MYHYYIRTTETFNKDILNHIITHKEELISQMRTKIFDGGKDPFKNAEEYLKNSKDGKIDVKYRQNYGHGRYCALKCLSLQSLVKEIRHSISREYYVDIDMANAQPTILRFLCKLNKFEHSKLDYYIENREKCMEELEVDRDTAKIIFLSIINGGKLAMKQGKLTQFKVDFEKELKQLHEQFSFKYKKEFNKKKKAQIKKGKNYNHKASFLNSLLCDYENKILMCMYDFYKKPKDVVLCYDGIMIRKKETNEYELEKCEQYVEDILGIKIQLKMKEMDNYFDFGDAIIEPYIQIIDDEYEENKDIIDQITKDVMERHVNDTTMALIFHQAHTEDIIVINEAGDGFKWNENKKLWIERTAGEIMNTISDQDGPMVKSINKCIFLVRQNILNTDTEEKEELRKLKIILTSYEAYRYRLQSIRHIRDIYASAKVHFRDINYLNTINRNHDLLPIQNGKIIELKTGNIRERKKEDKFSIECPVNFIPETEWTEDDIKNNSLFINQIFMDNNEYIEYKRIKLGSYLSGECTRDIDINHGCGKNGKSSLIDALAIMLGDFLGYIGKNVIVCDPKAHKANNANSHTSHLIPIDGKRLIITQELEEGDTLHSDMIKKIASADPIEGVREVYGKKTRTIFPFCKLVVSSNKIPKFDVQDNAIVDRLCFNPYKARFLNEESLAQEKESGKFDETKYKYYNADIKLIEKFKKVGRQIDILFSWLVGGCIEFYRVREKGIKKPTIVKEYIKNMIDEVDIVGQWINEKCNIISKEIWNTYSKTQKKQYTIKASELYDDFSGWATQNNCHTGYGKKIFYKHLGERVDKKKINKGFIYERIQLINEEDDGTSINFILGSKSPLDQ